MVPVGNREQSRNSQGLGQMSHSFVPKRHPFGQKRPKKIRKVARITSTDTCTSVEKLLKKGGIGGNYTKKEGEAVSYLSWETVVMLILSRRVKGSNSIMIAEFIQEHTKSRVVLSGGAVLGILVGLEKRGFVMSKGCPVDYEHRGRFFHLTASGREVALHNRESLKCLIGSG